MERANTKTAVLPMPDLAWQMMSIEHGREMLVLHFRRVLEAAVDDRAEAFRVFR